MSFIPNPIESNRHNNMSIFKAELKRGYSKCGGYRSVLPLWITDGFLSKLSHCLGKLFFYLLFLVVCPTTGYDARGAQNPDPPKNLRVASPTITAVTTSSITSFGAIITWITNEPSDSQIEYGLTKSYGNMTPLDTILVTNHTQTIAGLSAGTTYQYRVKSRGSAGNLAGSQNFTLTTSGGTGIGEGTIMIERIGETSTRETAPFATTWVDPLTVASDNPAIFASLSAGSHNVFTSNIIGLTERMGTCTFPIGGSQCTVTNFFSVSDTCTDAACSGSVTVLDGQVTRVAFKYVGVYEGFGSQVTGGKNGAVYHVTNLNDAGSGSFRDAVSQGNRYVVFDVAGDISLARYVSVLGKDITIDGFTAPPPGITIRRGSLQFRVTYGGINVDIQNIIVRGLRIRRDGVDLGDLEPDGINFHGYVDPNRNPQVDRPHNIVIDHNSISGALDEMVSSGWVNDLTFSYNIISQGIKSQQSWLTATETTRISAHHNLMTHSCCRNPQSTYNIGQGTGEDPSTSIDVRNNLIGLTQQVIQGPSGGSTWGTLIARGSTANIINNYYIGLPDLATDINGSKAKALNNAIIVCNPNANWKPFGSSRYCGFWPDPEANRAGGAYVSGNIALSAYNPPLTLSLDERSTEIQPFPAEPVTLTDAATAACLVTKNAGVRPLDAHDQAMVDEIELELEKFVDCGSIQP